MWRPSRSPCGQISTGPGLSNASGGLDLFNNQSSGVLTSAVWGDGVIDNPAGAGIAQGDTVQFLPFSSLIG